MCAAGDRRSLSNSHSLTCAKCAFTPHFYVRTLILQHLIYHQKGFPRGQSVHEDKRSGIWGPGEPTNEHRGKHCRQDVCKALGTGIRYLQSVVDNVPEQGVQWVSKRCHAVNVMVMDVGNLDVNSMEQLLPLITSLRGPNLRSLCELHLLNLSRSNNVSPGSQATAEIIHAVLSQAAATATALRVLRCYLCDVVPGKVFPVIRQLEHLVLWVLSEGVLPEVAAALPHMRQLQTVHLNMSMRGHDGREMSALNLTPCATLQSVRLRGVAPAGLHLPSSCIIHLDFRSWQAACPPVWASLRTVGSLYYDQALPDGYMNDFVRPRLGGHVPWLNGPVRLDTVCLDGANGDVAPMKTAAIAGARRIIICGRDLHLRIPAHYSWESIEVHSAGSLSLDFEDLPAFVRNPPAFSFEFQTAKGLGIWSLLKALGTSWEMQMYEGVGNILHLCNRCVIDVSNDMWRNPLGECDEEIMYFPYGINRLDAMCRCGACSKCLFKAGKVTI
ncbi:hypothetical protein COCOBI_04-0340 [Coccomyxa sp. Obi]|nr:hypothetical protein COCOBI_04-0340 [Coccomyxa sp. Obi]